MAQDGLNYFVGYSKAVKIRGQPAPEWVPPPPPLPVHRQDWFDKMMCEAIEIKRSAESDTFKNKARLRIAERGTVLIQNSSQDRNDRHRRFAFWGLRRLNVTPPDRACNPNFP